MCVLCGLALGLAINEANAVILKGSDDPTYNTTPPTGALADSGWQYQIQLGGFLGTAIAPQYFMDTRDASSKRIFSIKNYSIHISYLNSFRQQFFNA